MVCELRVVPRDWKLLTYLARWGACCARHLSEQAGFDSQRTLNRRVRLLIDAGYIERQKYIYGLPYVYTLTAKGKTLIGDTTKKHKIKIGQLQHDITVLDTTVYLHKTRGIAFDSMITEKQLHCQDGFSNRKHRPDFIYTDENGNRFAVEVELTLKAKPRLQQNIQDNFLNYDTQIWVVPNLQHKIAGILLADKDTYPNIEIIELDEVKSIC